MATNTDSQRSVLDVAEYVLQKTGPLGSLKLQKLVYYAQAWSLVWRNRALFSERVEAWINGPAVPVLWQVHQGKAPTASVGGDPARLRDDERATIDEILHYYGRESPRTLRNLSHDEAPWQDARAGLPENKPSTAEITHESMRAFYSARPCGGGQPLRDISAFSAERVSRSREQLERGESVDLDGLRRALEG